MESRSRHQRCVECDDINTSRNPELGISADLGVSIGHCILRVWAGIRTRDARPATSRRDVPGDRRSALLPAVAERARCDVPPDPDSALDAETRAAPRARRDHDRDGNREPRPLRVWAGIRTRDARPATSRRDVPGDRRSALLPAVAERARCDVPPDPDSALDAETRAAPRARRDHDRDGNREPRPGRESWHHCKRPHAWEVRRGRQGPR